MPTALEELRIRLAEPPLPKSLPIAQVVSALSELGYDLQVRGSHHHFRKQGERRLTLAVHSKRIGPAAVRELAARLREG